MSLDKSGLDAKLKSQPVELFISQDHSLIQLANALDWERLYAVAEPDLKTGIQWPLGRKLKLRIHLPLFLLQSLKQFTDRQMEEELRYNAAYQVFCGVGVVEDWHCPDHTSIERFRNRMQPETQRALVNAVLQEAKAHGFADPSRMDVDSTVQEANISYPSDARLLMKLSEQAAKVVEGLKSRGEKAVEHIQVNLKAVKAKAKTYFFLSKTTKKEKKRAVFEDLYKTTEREVTTVLEILQTLPPKALASLKWNLKQTAERLLEQAAGYLEAVAHFVKTHHPKPGKLLAFHAKAVTCISKGKLGRAHEFGRVFQLGRIGGNFMMVKQATTLREEDAQSLQPFVSEHQQVFGEGKLQSMTTDKNYFAKDNVLKLSPLIEELYLQQAATIKKDWSGLDEQSKEGLSNRRAGIEPLIGHLKNDFALDKSRMKSDKATLASGYRSVLGFNLHQLIRHQQGAFQRAGP